jgi:hypothetical protein
MNVIDWIKVCIKVQWLSCSRSTVSHREMEYGNDVRSIMANLVSFKHKFSFKTAVSAIGCRAKVARTYLTKRRRVFEEFEQR